MNQDSQNLAEFAFSRFLKFWRSVHNLSQESLAEKLGSSPRHISRLENGSSRPSETMVHDIAKAFKLGDRDSNHLLVSAGYAAIEKNVDFHSPELKWLRNAMTMNLRALDPYPTALLDSSSNILMVNRSWVGFFSSNLTSVNLDQVSNYYDFIFSREGAGNILSHWQDTLSVILMSLTQRGLFSDKAEDKAIAKKYAQHPNVPADWRQRASALEPMASFRVQIQIDGELKRFFNVSSTVGALGPAAFVSEPNLTIQTLYPESEMFDLGVFVDEGLKHPLLYY